MGGMLGGMGLPPGLFKRARLREPLARLIDALKHLPGNRPEIRAAHRLPRPAGRAPGRGASRPSPCSTSRTSWVCAASATTSATRRVPLLPRSGRDPTVVWRGRGAHQHRGHRNHAPVRRPATNVLHGALSPLRGIGPESLKIKGLVERIGQGENSEVIVATNPTVEGEATAVYLARLLKPLVSRCPELRWASGRQRPGIRRRGHESKAMEGPPGDVASRQPAIPRPRRFPNPQSGWVRAPRPAPPSGSFP